MDNLKPLVSFIICIQKEERLQRCLDNIKKQNYPQDRIEPVVILDDRLPEGYGNKKWDGCRRAKGEYIAIVDDDNVVVGTEWLNQMLEPMLQDSSIIGSHSRILVDKNDSLINRYIALNGTDPVFAYRSINGNKYIYEHVYTMSKHNMLITGGNAFIYRKSALDSIGGYTSDCDNIFSFAEKGICKIVVPKNALTHHLAATSISSFLTKKCKWSRRPSSKKWKWIEPRLFWEIFLNLTIIANIFKAVHHYYRDGKEPAWSLHPILAFLTTVIYGFNFIKSKCKSKCKSKDI